MLPGEESGKVRAAVILPGQKKDNIKKGRPYRPTFLHLSCFRLSYSVILLKGILKIL